MVIFIPRWLKLIKEIDRYTHILVEDLFSGIGICQASVGSKTPIITILYKPIFVCENIYKSTLSLKRKGRLLFLMSYPKQVIRPFPLPIFHSFTFFFTHSPCRVGGLTRVGCLHIHVYSIAGSWIFNCTYMYVQATHTEGGREQGAASEWWKGI